MMAQVSSPPLNEMKITVASSRPNVVLNKRKEKPNQNERCGIQFFFSIREISYFSRQMRKLVRDRIECSVEHRQGRLVEVGVPHEAGGLHRTLQDRFTQ